MQLTVSAFNMKSLPIALLLLASCCAVIKAQYTPAGRLCNNPTVDAVLYIPDEVYFFQGSDYWIRKPTAFADVFTFDGPTPIKETWPDFEPESVDAAYTINDSVNFFSGDYIYLFDKYDHKLADGYPMKITDNFPGIAEGPVTAATTYTFQGKTSVLLFQDDMFFDVDLGTMEHVKKFWGQTEDPPADFRVDGAFDYEGFLIFIKGESYYKYDKKNDDIYDLSTYPRSVAKYWFYCPDNV